MFTPGVASAGERRPRRSSAILTGEGNLAILGKQRQANLILSQREGKLMHWSLSRAKLRREHRRTTFDRIHFIEDRQARLALHECQHVLRPERIILAAWAPHRLPCHQRTCELPAHAARLQERRRGCGPAGRIARNMPRKGRIKTL
jgi:hypothetical protein